MNTCRFRRLEQRVNADSLSKIFSRSLGGTLRTRSFYLHLLNVALPNLLSTLNPQLSTLLRSTSLYLHVSPFRLSPNSVKERGSNGALRSQPSTPLKTHGSAQHFHRVS